MELTTGFFHGNNCELVGKKQKKTSVPNKNAAQKSVFMKSSSVLNSMYFKKISFSGFNRFISFKLGSFFTQVTKSMEGCWNGS
jgi:hypothetical protein